MTTRRNKLMREAFSKRAHAVYDADVRHLVEPEHHGEYLTLDVTTGEYEVDADSMVPMLRMLESHPPENLFSFRVGFPAFGTFSGWGRAIR